MWSKHEEEYTGTLNSKLEGGGGVGEDSQAARNKIVNVHREENRQGQPCDLGNWGDRSVGKVPNK